MRKSIFLLSSDVHGRARLDPWSLSPQPQQPRASLSLPPLASPLSLSQGCTKRNINVANIILLLCTSAYTHQLPCGFQPAAQLPDEHAHQDNPCWLWFPPEATNLEQGLSISNTPFQRAWRSLPVSAATGYWCPALPGHGGALQSHPPPPCPCSAAAA